MRLEHHLVGGYVRYISPHIIIIIINRKLQIPHRGALYQGQIALPLQVWSIRPVYSNINICSQVQLVITGGPTGDFWTY